MITNTCIFVTDPEKVQVTKWTEVANLQIGNVGNADLDVGEMYDPLTLFV